MKANNRKRPLAKGPSKNFIIIGTSGHAKVVYDVFNLALSGSLNFVGFITSDKMDSFLGRLVLGSQTDAPRIFKEYKITKAFIAIGSGFHRERINKSLLAKEGVSAVNIIHPSAIIEKNVKIGSGNFIGARAIINSFAKIGSHCLINSGAIIEHDCVLGDFVTVSPGARIGGRVRIGKRSFIGIGANVAHKQSIGKDVVIGAGATVISNIKERSVAVGCPAKVIKERKINEAYL